MRVVMIIVFVISLGMIAKVAFAQCNGPTCRATLIAGIVEERYRCPNVNCTGMSGELPCTSCSKVPGTGGPGGFDETLACYCQVG